jgi:hypothetical protein
MGRERLTVVPSDEGVPVVVLLDTVHVFLRLLESDIHVAVQTRQNAYEHRQTSERSARIFSPLIPGPGFYSHQRRQ